MLQIDLSTTKDVSIIVAGLIALITFVTGTLEYRRRGRQERAETFMQMRRRFQESPEFRLILDLVTKNDPTVAHVNSQERRNLAGFLEEVGLMVNSGLIRPEVARVMFGVYVDLVKNSPSFWEGLEPESPDWTMFRRLSKILDDVGKRPPASNNRLRF